MSQHLGKVVISVIMPVYNCQNFIQDCLHSIFAQKLTPTPAGVQLHVELSIYEDGSTDNTMHILEQCCAEGMKGKGSRFSWVMSKNTSGTPMGVGHGRNRAIDQCSGDYLCFCDADDIMEPERIIIQYLAASKNHNALIGSCFKRIPHDSTRKFTFWANNLTQEQLITQIFLTFGPTLVMPTWFCHKSLYHKVPGGFDEGGKGTPEDLIFFYKHLNAGGNLFKCPESLMVYRYHPSATTFSIADETIWRIRLDRLESTVLQKWDAFTIWNAGKSGRRLYRALKDINRKKVTAFCDVDPKKLKQQFFEAYPLKTKVPIVSPKDAKAPFIICVKTELIWDDGGAFREILDSLSLSEGTHYFYFN